MPEGVDPTTGINLLLLDEFVEVTGIEGGNGEVLTTVTYTLVNNYGWTFWETDELCRWIGASLNIRGGTVGVEISFFSRLSVDLYEPHPEPLEAKQAKITCIASNVAAADFDPQ